jgi:hypothetical protein
MLRHQLTSEAEDVLLKRLFFLHESQPGLLHATHLFTFASINQFQPFILSRYLQVSDKAHFLLIGQHVSIYESTA